MTRKLSAEEKAVRKAARRAFSARTKAAAVERKRAAAAAGRFNPRSTRESVRRAVFKDAALTLEEYRAADALGLIGSGVSNEPPEAMPTAYDGPHQVRWDAASWQGFTRLSTSRAINNASDAGWDWTDDEPSCTIDEDVVDEEDAHNSWYAREWWGPTDHYDDLYDNFGGHDLTNDEYLSLWSALAEQGRKPD